LGIPLFHIGFSKVLSVDDMPDVDIALQGANSEKRVRDCMV